MNKKESLEKAEDILRTTSKFVKQATDTIVDTGANVSASVSKSVSDARFKMMHPIFIEDFSAPDFVLPKTVHVVESDKRQKDPLCAGSIGWIDTNKGMDVLHLYYKTVASANLGFFPALTCDQVYYYDVHDPHSFIQLTAYFSEVQKSKFAELEHIAYCLGAKHYSIQVEEESYSMKAQKTSTKTRAKGVDVSADTDALNRDSTQIKISTEASFESSVTPRVPDLVWYKNDPQVANLIRMRLSVNDGYKMTDRKLVFDYHSSSTMSISVATKLDDVINGMGFKANFSLKSEAEAESRSRLIYSIQF